MCYRKSIYGIISHMKNLAYNKRASFDYHLLEFFEAGIVLNGNEVKSVKQNRASLKGAYVTIRQGEAYLINAHIPHYQNQVTSTYEPDRTRKLLLNRKEIDSLIGKKQANGLTIVPVRVYLKRGKVKVEVALAKGKQSYDKRQAIKEREEKRLIQQKTQNF